MPHPSFERPASALRLRVLEDMAMRGLREATQRDYIRFVRAFAAFLGRSPDTATAEDSRNHRARRHPKTFTIAAGMHPCSITL